ncbi:MAG: FimB/Mfa2 family fimbrial subunit [Parabacteroides sp.]|nr:FimB/Mfa2 family fimbrial subunit [Parabacteroides sp.]
MTGRNRYICALFLSLLFGLGSCTEENLIDEGGTPSGEQVALSLQIGVSEGNDVSLQTKATNAEKGELISTLKAFIVNEYGYIETVVPFTFADAQKAEMATGDLASCLSDKFLLYPGTYTIYAFANCEKLSEMEEVLKTTRGKLTLPDVVTWPYQAAFQPGGTEGFIPMSGEKSFTVGYEGGTVSVSLVRLLSKIQVSFRNTTAKDVTVDSWSLEEFNTKINLFQQNSIQAMTSEAWSIGKSYTSSPITIEAEEKSGVTEKWFYVTESKMNDGFAITLNSSKIGSEGKKYTSTKTLSRNHIWPIEILFSDYYLVLSVQGENPPIGGYPAVTTKESLTNTLTCNIVGGGPFVLTPTLRATAEEQTVPEVTWSVSAPSNKLIQELSVVVVEGKSQIVGCMAGSPIVVGAEDGEKLVSDSNFTLTAKVGDKELASFTITLKFEDIFN